MSGSTQGITSDCTECTANAPNLADRLERAHRTWKAYLQGLPRPCSRPAGAGRYAKKHDPFTYDDAIARDPARCRRRVPLTQLAADVRRDRLPDFAFVAPDLCEDTHDCSVATGDRFLARLVPACCPRSAPTASSSSPTTRAPGRGLLRRPGRRADHDGHRRPGRAAGRGHAPADRPLRRAAQHRDGLRAAVARRRARSAARIARAAVPKPRDPLALGAGRPQAIRFAVG